MGIELPLRDPVLQVTVVVLAALLVQVLLTRAHLPGLLGLLVLGMLLGPGGGGVLAEEPIVEPLGEIGLLFVMFIAGLEIDLEVVSRHRRETILFGLLSFGCTAVPAFAVGLWMGFTPPAALLLGALISSHTLLAYPVLMRLRLLNRLPVMAAIGGTLLTDTLALLVLAAVLGPEWTEAIPLGWLLPIALLVALSVAALWGIPRLARAFLARTWVSRPERALFSLSVLLVLAALADLIGTEGILGAFLAGVCLNRALARRESLREHVEFLGRVLFLPFFFLWTGTLLELGVFTGWPGVWPIAGALVGLVVIGKGLAAWLTGAFFAYPSRDRLLMLGLTVPQAAATLAIAITARRAGLFDEALVDAVIIVIFVTCLAGPIFTDRVGRGFAAEERQPEPSG